MYCVVDQIIHMLLVALAFIVFCNELMYIKMGKVMYGRLSGIIIKVPLLISLCLFHTDMLYNGRLNVFGRYSQLDL